MLKKFIARKPKARKAAVEPLQAPGSPPEAAQAPGGPAKKPAAEAKRPKELGGPSGPEPTRYGDWEINGRCIDF